MPYEDEDLSWGRGIEPPADLDEVAKKVIGAAIEVHRHLGAGLPEIAYQNAMENELTLRGIAFERQKEVNIAYKGMVVGRGKIDLLVESKLVVEIKSVDQFSPVHRYQIISYMRILKQPLGLLLNFNVPTMKDGIKRVIHTF